MMKQNTLYHTLVYLFSMSNLSVKTVQITFFVFYSWFPFVAVNSEVAADVAVSSVAAAFTCRLLWPCRNCFDDEDDVVVILIGITFSFPLPSSTGGSNWTSTVSTPLVFKVQLTSSGFTSKSGEQVGTSYLLTKCREMNPCPSCFSSCCPSITR